MDESGYRLACLTLVLDHCQDEDEDDILKIAEKFATFVLTGKIDEEE